MNNELSLSRIDEINEKLYSQVKKTKEEYDEAYADSFLYDEEANVDGGVEPESSSFAAVRASMARTSLAEFYNKHKDELHEIALKEAPKE